MFTEEEKTIKLTGVKNGIHVEFFVKSNSEDVNGNFKTENGEYLGNFNFLPTSKSFNINREDVSEIHFPTILELLNDVYEHLNK